jgi:hypothetical protein
MNCHQTLMFINFPMWVILEMGNTEVASFNTKSWSSMTWMMHRGTPMTSDKHDFLIIFHRYNGFPPKHLPVFPSVCPTKTQILGCFPMFFQRSLPVVRAVVGTRWKGTAPHSRASFGSTTARPPGGTTTLGRPWWDLCLPGLPHFVFQGENWQMRN